ncbi:MAG TPA: RNA methyltransferase [bacterium]|nr:RNA methyltransferase [bacterium]
MVRPREPSPTGEGSRRSAGETVPDLVVTSRHNPLIQDLRALLRSSSRRTSRCVAEGWRVLEAAGAAGAKIDLVICTPAAAADPRGAEVARRLRAGGARLVTVSAYVFEPLSQVESPQGVLGVARRPPDASPAVLTGPHALIAVLDGVQDPGNVGAILRTAAAAGATGAIVVGATADPFGPKAIRASAGAVFRLPVRSFPNAAEAAEALHTRRVRMLIADPRGDHLDSQVSYARPLALVLGSEAHGASPTWTRRGVRVRIPMAQGAESLNVAAAAAILLYRAGGDAGSIDA